MPTYEHRYLKPVKSNIVEDWLNILDVDNKQFKHWLRNSYYHRTGLRPLYFYGPPGSGKTLLAEGISKLWYGTSRLAEAATPLGFNRGLLKSPLIILDEGSPEEIAHLRRETLAKERTIRTKGEAPFIDQGFLRGIVTSNSKHPPQGFLHVGFAKSRAFLEKLSVQTVVDMVQNDVVAKHITWLDLFNGEANVTRIGEKR